MSEITDWHCSQEDCPFHPVDREYQANIQKHKVITDSRGNEYKISNSNSIANSNMQNILEKYSSSYDHYSVNTHDNLNAINSIMTMDSPYVGHKIPFECLICRHMEKMDMRDNIIAEKAKQVLREE